MTKKHAIRHVVDSFYSTPWAITEAKYSEILGFLEKREKGLLSESEIAAFSQQIDPDEEDDFCMDGCVAIVPVYGVISQRMNLLSQFSGGTSTEMLGKTIQKCLKNPACKAIVLDVNSPGGSVGGVAEVADFIHESCKSKPIYSVANTQMCSAAYWIGAAAERVYASPSATVGSVGVYMTHSETSAMDSAMGRKRTIISAGKWKTVGNDAQPLTTESKGRLQEYVDAAYGLFVDSIAKYRGCKASDVTSGYGEGDVMMGKNAVNENLADEVATLSEVVARLNSQFNSKALDGAAGKGVPSPLKMSLASKMKGFKMDSKLVAALYVKGLIAECSEEAAKAFFAARAEAVPTDAAAYIETLFPKQKAEDKNPEPQSTAIDYDVLAEKIDARAAARAEKEKEYLKTQSISICELMGLDATATAEIVAMGKSLDEVRAIVRERISGPGNGGGIIPRPNVTKNEMQNFSEGVEKSLDARCFASAGLEGSKPEPNNPFNRMRLLEIGEKALQLCGVRTSSMTRNQIAKLALGMDQPYLMANAGGAAYYGTGSFPNLTLNSMRKVLAKVYEETPVSWRTWARQGDSVPDFKLFSVIKFGEGSDLEEVPEGKSIPEDTTLADSREYAAVSKFEKIISFTWEMMANDDLSALSRLPMMQSRAAARTVNKKVYSILTGNPALADGITLFHASSHGANLIGTGSTTAAPPSISTLSAMQAILRTQKGLNSDAILNLFPVWLIVPAALEITANVLLRSQTDPALSNPAVQNQFYGVVKPVVEPLLDATSAKAWYVAADAGTIDTVQVKFLEGEETPFTETWWVPENDSRKYKIRQTFAVLPVAYQGLAKHTGYSA